MFVKFQESRHSSCSENNCCVDDTGTVRGLNVAAGDDDKDDDIVTNELAFRLSRAALFAFFIPPHQADVILDIITIFIFIIFAVAADERKETLFVMEANILTA